MCFIWGPPFVQSLPIENALVDLNVFIYIITRLFSNVLSQFAFLSYLIFSSCQFTW